MRQPQNAKRGRGRGRRSNGSSQPHVPNRNTSYESNGPDVKLRGNAQQLNEKYLALAHDAAAAGERITAEAYTQFADHYFRLHQAAVDAAEERRVQHAERHSKSEAPQPSIEDGTAEAAQVADKGNGEAEKDEPATGAAEVVESGQVSLGDRLERLD